MIRKNKAKAILQSGAVALGAFVTFTDPSIIEALGLMGYDFIVLDNEHVAMDRSTVFHAVRASEMIGVDITPLIRIREGSHIEILQALDLGALGVQVPEVNTYEQAKLVVDSAYYAPKGNRGLGTTNRGVALGFKDRFEYFEEAEKEILVVAQCESKESVSNIDKILSVDGIDVVFIGAMDLSRSIGKHAMGRRNHPEVVKMFNETAKRIIDAGKVAGAAAGSVEEAMTLIDLGVRYLTIGNDITFLRNAATLALGQCKQYLKRAEHHENGDKGAGSFRL